MTTSAAQTPDVPDVPAPDGGGSSIVGRTPWQLFWSRFKQDRFALAGAGFVLFLIILAFFAPAIAAISGHGPNELFQRETTDIFGIPEGPTSSFWFGADNSGRDVFVRTIYGIRVSLVVGIVATGVAVFVGRGARRPGRLLRRLDRHADLARHRHHPVDPAAAVRDRHRRRLLDHARRAASTGRSSPG